MTEVKGCYQRPFTIALCKKQAEFLKTAEVNSASNLNQTSQEGCHLTED